MTVRTRFAPSPTGSLHVGGARTALYCLLHARHHGGRFLLRIEDTDQTRSTHEAAQGILRDLRWLGLSWDEGPGAEDEGTGPYFQSKRLDTYGQFFDQLMAADVAYEAWDTPAELTALREAARADKRNFRYRRTRYTQDQRETFRAEGRKPVLRLAAPDHAIHIDDDILGTVTVAADDLDDIIIRKADGFPTYHFAVVIDDHLMGVSQVLRGQEHLLNTPKHIGLYQALAWTPPSHGHLPLIFNPGGSKMSKRDKAKAARQAAREAINARKQDGHDPKDYQWLADATGTDTDTVTRFMKKKHDGVALAQAIAAHLGVRLPMIEVGDFRAGGYLPEALLNYLALLGWSPGEDLEIMSLEEMTQRFSLDRVNKTAARFDTAKLEWMNGEYIRAASEERLFEAFQSYLAVVDSSHFSDLSDAQQRDFLSLYRKRMTTFAHLEDMAQFFFETPTEWVPKAVKRHLLKGDGLSRLAAVLEALEALQDWSATGVQACLDALATEHEVGMGKFAQPARVAVTGNGVSPEIDQTLALLGRDQTLARMQACLAAVTPA
jgi:glutamyl-tRNA synthetase